MKTSVKMMISVVMAAAFTLAFGLAYAADDQMPVLNASKDSGSELYAAFLKHDVIGSGAAPGGVREDLGVRPSVYTSDEVPFMNLKDTGTELYEDFLKHDADIVKGSAPGGRSAGPDRSDEYISDTLPGWNQKR